DLFVTADAREPALLQRAQEELLRLVIEVRQFLDEQRPVSCALEVAGPYIAILFHAEQLLFRIRLGAGSPEEHFQWLLCPRAQGMDVARERASPRTRFADEEHGRVVPRILLDLVPQILHQPAASYRRQQ